MRVKGTHPVQLLKVSHLMRAMGHGDLIGSHVCDKALVISSSSSVCSVKVPKGAGKSGIRMCCCSDDARDGPRIAAKANVPSIHDEEEVMNRLLGHGYNLA